MSSVNNTKSTHLTIRHAAALASLSPPFRIRVEQVLNGLAGLGWQPIVFSGRRLEKEQQALVKSGTGATKSWHAESHHQDIYRGITFTINGEAADIVDRRYLWSGEWKAGQHPRDVAHVQLKAVHVTQDVRGMRA